MLTAARKGIPRILLDYARVCNQEADLLGDDLYWPAPDAVELALARQAALTVQYLARVSLHSPPRLGAEPSHLAARVPHCARRFPI